MYVENSNIFVLIFLAVYLILVKMIANSLKNNHLSLKAFVIFIGATILLQIGKAYFNINPLAGRYLVIFSILMIDVGTVLLNLKEIKYTFNIKNPKHLNNAYNTLLMFSLLFIVLSLVYLNEGYIRLHTGIVAYVGLLTILKRIKLGKNFLYDLFYSGTYLFYGSFSLSIALHEIANVKVNLYYYLLLAVGFLFHLAGLTRKYDNGC